MDKRTEKGFRFLRYYFSEEEKKEIADKMATAHNAVNRLEMEKKDAVAQFTSQISSAKKEVSECAQSLSKGYEMRNIECEILNDFAKNKVIVKRLDTGETVDERAMTSAERQLEMAVK